MRKFIFYVFLISLLIVSCSQDKKGYDALEKGLIGILEKKDEGYILQQLEKSAEQKNEDVFALAYVYLGTQGEEFYNKFLTHKRLTKKNFNCIMIQIFKFGGSVYEKV